MKDEASTLGHHELQHRPGLTAESFAGFFYLGLESIDFLREFNGAGHLKMDKSQEFPIR